MATETEWLHWLAQSHAAILGTFTIPPPQLAEPPRWVRVEHKGDYGVTVTAQFEHVLRTTWARYEQRPRRQPRHRIQRCLRVTRTILLRSPQR